MSEPLCVWFSGAGKHHYAKATANLLIDKEVVWMDRFRYIWDNNILVNLSGREMKFMGIDKEAVHQSASKYISPLASVSDISHKHGTVDDKEDCKVVFRTLLQHDVCNFRKGRWKAGSVHNPVEMKPALDLFTLGERIITRGSFLDDIMKERVGGIRGDDDASSECSEDRLFREEEERYLRERPGAPGDEYENIDLEMEQNMDMAPEEERIGLVDIREDSEDEEDSDVDYGEVEYGWGIEGRERWREG
ncbi:hypothetical protein L211DRAFT_848510 [Terfezia boudieri ATCC MYA-4762]|uniref:DUF6589 domain-containing protein n=1 Tax=Terfezia boudieri ATCC MYA-4762 TaxID=1051890 RepID=A0A3N4LP50_9PEZI|nr:hypothetical protein L211DRAFT_848510 [Terfezia boudieri ATCC MYA-4762]